MSSTINVFFCYAHQDRAHRDVLEKHLSVLKRSGTIRGWHDRQIVAGEDWAAAISEHLEAAHLILPLVSVDFLASEYCYEKEMKRALERLEQKTAWVVPIVLRDCDWKHSPLGKLQMLPSDALPVANWTRADDAWANVVRGIRATIEQLSTLVPIAAPAPAAPAGTPAASNAPAAPASLDIYAAYHGLKSVLTTAKDALISEGLVEDFVPPTGKHWQEDHDRIGWRLFVDRRRESFAFMGVYEGEETICRSVPDLYFFLEMKRGGDAQKLFDAQKAQINQWVKMLGATHPHITWGYTAGGWESVWAMKSLNVVAVSDDARAATIEFFRTVVMAMRSCGLLDEYVTQARK